MRLKIAHASMQYSDPEWQHRHDARAIFRRGYAWITGTEAGETPTQTILRDTAHDAGYTFDEYKSNWISVRKNLMMPGTFMHDAVTVVDNDLTVGAGHDTSLMWTRFENEKLGSLTVMCSHYPRFGQPDNPDPAQRVNLQYTKAIAHAIGDKARQFGSGKPLVFYGGDQNIPDGISDTFFGEPMTSTWDELGMFQHSRGPIDVIATYNYDGRVSVVSSKVLTDQDLYLYGDHPLIEAVIDVKEL